MVDAQAATTAHAGPQGGDEGLEAVRNQGLRSECREAPILPMRIELIGWCADAEVVQEILRPGADLGARAVDADRKIANQADAHSGGFSRRLRRTEGLERDPLQEGVVENRCRPAALLCFEPCVLIEIAAAVAHEGQELGGERRVLSEVLQREFVE